jgi:hypothetical protein
MNYPVAPICIQFSKGQQTKNACVSDFLQLPPTEKTERPIYYHWKDHEYRGQVWDALYYVLFYPYNPGYQVLCKTVGFHEGDLERVIVLYSKDTKEPKWVYFGAHGQGQGVWREYAKCKFSNDGTLRVFVSPTSHAFYPEAHSYSRVCFAANDVCDESGEEWKPLPSDFEPSENQIWSETYQQLRPGINSPLYARAPNEHSISHWERILLFLPCVRKAITMK